jgi:hypothetical protein
MRIYTLFIIYYLLLYNPNLPHNIDTAVTREAAAKAPRQSGYRSNLKHPVQMPP